MSDRAIFQVKLHSPRWGTQDVYEFQFERKQMKIEKVGSLSHAVCSWIEKSDPVWSGPNELMGHPLVSILENDSIYPPTIFLRALVYAWQAWRNSELKDEQVQAEITVLCEWLNKVSESKPKTEFWQDKF